MITLAVVSDMMKYSFLILALSFLCCSPAFAQAKYEREFRIRKSQFPQNALEQIEDQIKDARRLRFYKEIDSATISFEVKFKKDRLHYSVEFNSEGELEDIEVLIKEVDIPTDVFSSVSDYLEGNCTNFKIRRLQQQYPVTEKQHMEKVIKDAFQNLILPYINYEMVVFCKTDAGREEYEYLFNSDGVFISRRKSLPPNYDHILY
ncbi:hypothetical protein AB8P51_07595 [Muriicola sp. SD30]|uniref:hypothetical protein n=1 Tax=Muriicola sp. SD30 TaxID=3240936 RepID=UPI00350EF09A